MLSGSNPTVTGDVPDLPTLKLPSLSGPLSGFVPVETACTGGSGHKMAAAADPRPPHNPTGSRRRHSAEEKLFSALSAASWTNSARGRAGGRRAKGGHTSQPDAHVHHTHTHAATPCWSWPLFSFHHPLERKRREILNPKLFFISPFQKEYHRNPGIAVTLVPTTTWTPRHSFASGGTDLFSFPRTLRRRRPFRNP